jgi:ABC-type multidrug transport system ATPase subunit
MLEIRGLCVRYPSGKEALKKVDFSLREREKIAIVGPNGSGKSTLIKAALGLAPITEGSVRVFGQDVRKIRGETRVSTNLSEVYRLLSGNTKELIEVYSELKGVNKNDYLDLIRDFGLEEILLKVLHQMSSGQAKMFGNIMALGSKPELTLMDEPFENLDQNRRIKLARLIQEFEEEVVLVTHEFDLLKKFSGWPLYFMLEGSIYGPFNVSDLDALYMSRGERADALVIIRTSLGEFSITRGEGEVSLKNATSFNRLLEEVA